MRKITQYLVLLHKLVWQNLISVVKQVVVVLGQHRKKVCIIKPLCFFSSKLHCTMIWRLFLYIYLKNGHLSPLLHSIILKKRNLWKKNLIDNRDERFPLFIWKWNGFKLIWFNATFNNISVISWHSVLLVEKTGEHEENNPPATSHWLYHFITKSCFEYTSQRARC